MNFTRNITMLPLAVQDLNEIVDYLSQFYEETALAQFDCIVKRIRELPQFPLMYEIYPFEGLRLPYRRMPVDQYQPR